MSAVSHEVINKNAAHFSHYAPKVLPLIGASISLWLYAARSVFLLSCQFNATMIAGSIVLPFLVTLIAAVALKLYCTNHYNNLILEKLESPNHFWNSDNSQSDDYPLNNSQSEFLEWAFYAGASPDLKDSLDDPLLVTAAGTDQHEIVQLLINAGANLELDDIRGYTPLMVAVENGRKENVRALLKAGANPNCRDSNGDSVLSIAKKLPNPNQSIIELLINAGAKEVSTESAG